jgi:hypothetical protein
MNDMLPPSPPVKLPPADYLVSGGGSVYLIHPQNEQAKENLLAGAPEDAQFLGNALAVEHRYIGPLVEQLREEGWVVR